MKQEKVVVYVAVGVLTVGLIAWLRKQNAISMQASAHGVTSVSKDGEKITPIKTGAVAALEQAANTSVGILRRLVALPASVIQGGVPNRLQPYSNPVAANAAYNAPLRPDYVPTIRARESIVYLP